MRIEIETASSTSISYLSKFIDIINSPIFIVIVSGVILKIITDKRDKRDRLREQQVKFIEEVGETLHRIFPILFGEIQRKNFSKERQEEIEKLRYELFETRFTVYVKNKAYFNCNEFSKEYEDIIWELDEIITHLFKCKPTPKSSDKIIKKISNNIKKTSSSLTPIQKKSVQINEDSDIFEALDAWTNVVWFRSRKLLSETLENKTF